MQPTTRTLIIVIENCIVYPFIVIDKTTPFINHFMVLFPPSIKLIYLTNTLFFSKFHNHLIVDTPKLMDINCISLNDLQVGGHPTNQIGFIW